MEITMMTLQTCEPGRPWPRISSRAPLRLLAGCIAGVAAAFIAPACGGGETNRPPTIEGTPLGSVQVGQLYAFVPSAKDPDADVLTFIGQNLPAWASLDGETGALTGQPVMSDVGRYDDVLISVSDGRETASLPPFAIDVHPGALSRDNFSTEGEVIPTEKGFRSIGTLVVTTEFGEQRLENSDIEVSFDENGELVALSGETDVPKQPSDAVTIDAPDARAVLEMMTGAQINADKDFGIQLLEERSYLVFFIGVDIDITIQPRDNPSEMESSTVSVPAGGKILLVLDMMDPLLYRYGAVRNLGDYGQGWSLQGLIPFIPALESPSLDSFTGHKLERGTFPMSVAYIFRVFTVSGTRVIALPKFEEIDWQDPLASTADFRAGFNGALTLEPSALGLIGFNFGTVEASGTFDVGLDRQALALQMNISPDVSWVPEWFPFVPSSPITGEWSIEGDGVYQAALSGAYRSAVPPANVDGRLALTNGSTQLLGQIQSAQGPFEVVVEFGDETAAGRVDLPADALAGLDAVVLDALDRELERLETAIENYEQALSDYQLEVSLDGFRRDLPRIVDASEAILDDVPDQVAESARRTAVSYVNSACECVVPNPLGGCWTQVCLKDLVSATSVGNAAANRAWEAARKEVDPIIAGLQELKAEAEREDDDTLVEALRRTLLFAYSHRVFSERITVKYDFPNPIGTQTVYSKVHTETIIEPSDAQRILNAANNVHRIPETSDILIGTERIRDALPTEEAIARVRGEVEQALATIPSVEGFGFRIENSRYEGFILSGEDEIGVSFNVLDPVEALAGLGDYLAGQLLN